MRLSLAGGLRLVLAATALAGPVLSAPALGDSVSSPAAEAEQAVQTLVLAAPSSISLSGLPSYGGFDLVLPRDAPVSSAVLELAFAIDLAPEAGGLIRVAINGERRAEAVLRQADEPMTFSFPLTAADLVAESLRVSLSAVGDTGGGVCRATRDSGLAARLLPASRTVLEMGQGPLSVRDAWALRAQTLPVAANEDDPALAAALLEVLTRLLQAGHQARAVPHADALEGGLLLQAGAPASLRAVRSDGAVGAHLVIDAEAVADAVAALVDGRVSYANRPALRIVRTGDEPLQAVTALGQITGGDLTVSGTSQLRWRFEIPQRLLGVEAQLSGLDLVIATSVSLPGVTEIVQAEMNGRMLASALREAGTTDTLSVSIPPEALGLGNQVTVLLDRVQSGLSHCPQDWPQFSGVLRADSALRYRPAPDAEPGFQQLPAEWSGRTVGIAFAEAVGPAEINGLARLLSRIAPPSARFRLAEAATADILVETAPPDLSDALGLAHAAGVQARVEEEGERVRLRIQGDPAALEALTALPAGRDILLPPREAR